MIRLNRLCVNLESFSLRNVDIEVASGEFFCLLGPTGSGKTMILESIIGLVPVDSGTIEIQGRDVTRLAPEKRGVGIVYQDCALFPHLTVAENINYGVRYQKPGTAAAPALLRRLTGQMGIAILSIAGRNHWLGRLLHEAGVEIMGTVTGIITVLTFVGLPFYVNTVKAGLESIPQRLENVSRSLGASAGETFFRITLPLAWRHMVVGAIMCTARAVSEFGAVVIVAYHPMTAPVMIYERFTAYGLKYSQPVAVWLIVVCLVLFLLLRMFSLNREAAA